jgi:methyl-accepting chemotaxis protein
MISDSFPLTIDVGREVTLCLLVDVLEPYLVTLLHNLEERISNETTMKDQDIDVSIQSDIQALLRESVRKLAGSMGQYQFFCKPIAFSGPLLDDATARADQDGASMIADIATPIADIANPIADTAGQVADTASQIADTAGQIADTAGQVADTAGQVADTASPVADTAGQIASTASPIVDTASQPDAPAG